MTLIAQSVNSYSGQTYDIHNFSPNCNSFTKDNFWYRNIGVVSAPGRSDQNWGRQVEMSYDSSTCILTVPAMSVYFYNDNDAHVSIRYDLYLVEGGSSGTSSSVCGPITSGSLYSYSGYTFTQDMNNCKCYFTRSDTTIGFPSFSTVDKTVIYQDSRTLIYNANIKSGDRVAGWSWSESANSFLVM